MLFLKLFLHCGEHWSACKLLQDSCHQIHASLYHNTLYSVTFSYYFCFLQFASELNMEFCHKTFSIIDWFP